MMSILSIKKLKSEYYKKIGCGSFGSPFISTLSTGAEIIRLAFIFAIMWISILRVVERDTFCRNSPPSETFGKIVWSSHVDHGLFVSQHVNFLINACKLITCKYTYLLFTCYITYIRISNFQKNETQ